MLPEIQEYKKIVASLVLSAQACLADSQIDQKKNSNSRLLRIIKILRMLKILRLLRAVKIVE